MADMDGFREATNFGIGEAVKTEGVQIKGTANMGWGMKNRLSYDMEIEQIYLLSDDGVSERIRKRGVKGEYKYYHEQKKELAGIAECILRKYSKLLSLSK